MHLLRPLLVLEGFANQQAILEVIWYHAQQGLFIVMRHYLVHYTCRYQPFLQMMALLHLCDSFIRFFATKTEQTAKDAVEAVQIGLEALQQSRIGFPVAGPFQDMLCRSTLECNVRLPPNTDELLHSGRQRPMYRVDDFIEACTRPTYVQPVRDIQTRFQSNFKYDWERLAGGYDFKVPDARARIHQQRALSVEERNAQHLMDIRNIVNP